MINMEADEAKRKKNEQRRKDYAAAAPERRRAAAHKWAEGNPIKVREYKRKWYSANIERERERARKRWAENPDRHRDNCRRYHKTNPEQRLRWHLKRYGLTPADYNAMLKAQDGVCAACHGACSSGRRLAVDHCHAAGVVRGLLCGRCNTTIGKYSDSPGSFLKLHEYVRKHSQLRL